MFISQAIEERMKRGIKTVNYILLLSIYVAGISQFEVLHQVFHSNDNRFSHSAWEESDPCHRAVYHPDAEQKCDHHSHIVVTSKCELCDLIFHTDQLLLSISGSHSIKFVVGDFVFNSARIAGTSQLINSARAPPVV